VGDVPVSVAGDPVVREIRLLEVLATARGGRDGGVSVAACVESSGIPRASCHRLLQALVAAGYVRHVSRGRYALGWRMHVFCQQVLASSPLAGAGPVLEALVATTGQTAHLGVLDGALAVYLACVDSPSSLRLAARPGSRIPLNVSAIGMALAACLPDTELAALVHGTSWQARTPFSLCSPEDLWAELEQVRRRGYAVDDRGYALDVRCIAAPVLGPDGRAVAAVGITSLASELAADDPEPAQRVCAAAQQLQGLLAGDGPTAPGGIVAVSGRG
jgi:IclR family acetate operon transcriptional repressor